MKSFKMVDEESSIDWMRRRTEEYRSLKDDIKEFMDDIDQVGKLRRDFVFIEELEEN
jgi:membrane-bound lytic murein transglycosylase MltF